MSDILFDASIGKYRQRTGADLAYTEAVKKEAFPEYYKKLADKVKELNQLKGGSDE